MSVSLDGVRLSTYVRGMKMSVSALLTLLALAPLSAETGFSLSRQQAEDRFNRVSRVQYQMEINVGFAEEYSGRTVIQFDLSRALDLRLDFGGGTVKELRINGKPSPILHHAGEIKLPGALLLEGANRVEVVYSHPYSTTGDGLYRFKDPADGNLYLYSNFEPYAANQLFPCFDQPDLKAVYELTVNAPRDWVVISAAEAKVDDAGSMRQWKFAKTLPFSTYVMSLHAGPYASWESAAGKTRLRLFARKSIAQFVDHEEWFKITKQGFEFYEAYFGIPYPFGKYDQVFVPEFNWGGMENVAAVAFNERFIHRSKPTRAAELARADIILHELAHLWFGDLVTMKWWDDLWLNESFASYMSALAMARATEFTEAWEYFNWRMKKWAMAEDRLPTTHPVRTPIPDTASAHANFDGITYGKGASALKQLAFRTGDAAFKDAVRKYLKKHSFGNASLADFIAAMEESSTQKLGAWQNEWLDSAGLSSLRAQAVCKSGQLVSIVLLQSSVTGGAKPARHVTNVALFGPGGEKREIRMEYSGTSSTIPASGACPAAVFANAGDHDYVKLDFEESSLPSVRSLLETSSDPLMRLILWQSLWDRVREGRMSLGQYGTWILNAIEREGNSYLLSLQLEILAARDDRAASILSYTQDPAFRTRADSVVWKRLLESRPGKDQLMLVDAFTRTASSPEGLKNLRSLLEGGPIAGLQLDSDRRWAVILHLNIWTTDSSSLIDAEELRDRSDEGRKMAAQSRLARADAKTKAAFLDQAASGSIPDSVVKRQITALFPYSQRRLQEQFDDRIYDLIVQMSALRDHHFMKALTLWAAPVSCTIRSSARLESFLKSRPGLPVIAQKNLKAALQEDRICTGIKP